MALDDQNEFVIHSSEGRGSLRFFGIEKDLPGVIAGFSVCLAVENLNAMAQVDAYTAQHLTDFFDSLASSWQGWEEGKEWASLERELVLGATNDGRGHIRIVVTLHGGAYPLDWTVQGTIPTEAGLLDRIAADCLRFTGPKIRYRVD